jgi:hypothetical protein
MSAAQTFYQLLNVNIQGLSKHEIKILEVELLIRIYEELKEMIRAQNKDYFNLIKVSIEKESTMIEANFIRCIVNDILSTEEYSLPGIAYYTDTPEEVVYDIASGCNSYPSFLFASKVFELHRSIRPNLYREVMNKITETFKLTDM